MFHGKERPKGLEFLACEACNVGSSREELAAALLSRLLPDSEAEPAQAEFQRLLGAAENNFPGILRELRPSARQQKRARITLGVDAGDPPVLNVSGPIVNSVMQRFGAKMGLARHRHATGRIVPRQGGVWPSWYPNYDLQSGRFPDRIVALLGPPETLRQGRKEVGKQFQFAWLVAQDSPCVSVHMVTFRASFAVLAFVAEDSSFFEDIPSKDIFRPGFMKQSVVEPRQATTVFRTATLKWSQPQRRRVGSILRPETKS
jgi:hypothetical protein